MMGSVVTNGVEMAVESDGDLNADDAEDEK